MRALFLALSPALLITACASVPRVPSPEVRARAAAASVYSGTLRVDLRSPEFRGRARVFLAFRRPDALRVELPGPTGPRLVAVAKDGGLSAVFPAERAVFRAGATPEDMEALFGVALSPAEIADLLVGVRPTRLTGYEVRWGPAMPREVRAVLPDGGRLAAKVEEAEIDAEVPPAAFAEPPHEGFRVVDAAEARRLWSR